MDDVFIIIYFVDLEMDREETKVEVIDPLPLRNPPLELLLFSGQNTVYTL